MYCKIALSVIVSLASAPTLLGRMINMSLVDTAPVVVIVIRVLVIFVAVPAAASVVVAAVENDTAAPSPCAAYCPPNTTFPVVALAALQ